MFLSQKESRDRAIIFAHEWADSSLADLYDPNAMPKKLLDAHKALDAAVDSCYRPAGFKTDLERLKFLLELYRKYTEPLIQAVKKTTRKKRYDIFLLLLLDISMLGELLLQETLCQRKNWLQ